MLRKKIYLICAAAILCGGLPIQAAPLDICDDDGGWPPYTYADPKDVNNVIGAATDLIKEILMKSGFEPKIKLMPWKRCLEEVEKGKSAMLLNASYNEERAKKYLISLPYYTINSGLFYLNKRFPEKPKIASIAEMSKYSFCGLLGYNYTMYNIPADKLDTGAKNEKQRFDKLRAGRCDFAVGDIEILKGFTVVQGLDLNGIDSIPVPEDKPKAFHMLITRAPSGGEKLLKTLNDGLEQFKKDGSYEKIFKKYGI